jgi:predicted nucleotidyltransferase
MPPLIGEHIEGIAQLCEKYGVRKLELFGSACRGEFDPETSDLDFIAEFSDIDVPGYGMRFLDFADAIESLLARKIEVITTKSTMNPLFRRVIDECRIAIYESQSRVAAA